VSGRRCGVCDTRVGACPECGATYPHGTTAHCRADACKAMNAPVDCAGCGRPVLADLSGVLEPNGTGTPWG